MNALTATLPALRFHFGQIASSWLDILNPAPFRVERRRAPSHTLLPLQTEYVETAPGLQVTCLDGCLMLTYDGEQRDTILVRGETHACKAKGRLAVHAFVATELLIQ
jgi:hypothetical protein